MAKLTDVQRLAIVQAIYKQAAELVSTKDPDSLRGLCDEEILRIYDSVGAKSYEVKLPDPDHEGQEVTVGTYSVRVAKPKEIPAHLEVKDQAAFIRWAIINYPHKVRMVESIADEDVLLAEAFNNGEIPDGCIVAEASTEPAHVLGTLFKIDAQKVFAAAGRHITTATRKLLGTDAK